MAKLATFDIVSKVDKQEIDNAVNQAQREVDNRYDLKGTGSRIELSGEEVIVESSDEFNLKQVMGVLSGKLAKRGLDPRAIKFSNPEKALGGRARVHGRIINGIDKDTAKVIVKKIKDMGIKKVQSSIQDDQVRVSSKSIDDLQEVIANLKQMDLGIPLQFVNFRN